MIRIWFLAFTVLALAFAHNGFAQELTTSRSLALSGAMSAAASGTSAVWHNPAGIATAMMYAAEAGYQYDNARGGHGITANLMDMKSNAYVGTAIGFSYEYSKVNQESRHATQSRLGIGVPLADGLVSLGVSGIYTHSKLGGKKEISQFSMDAGLLIRPLKWLGIGFSAQNLITGDYADIMPRKLSTGLAFMGLEIGLNIMAEVVFNVSDKNPKNTAEYGVGAEYFLVNAFPLRLSYRYETMGAISTISAGSGYRDKSGVFGLDVSYQHQFEPKNHVFSSSLSVYF